MPMSFNRIVYEALDVCNGVEMSTLEAAIGLTGLQPGACAVDIGTGNAAVAIRLAQGFALDVTAIELDPLMAELAQNRIETAGLSGTVTLVATPAVEALAALRPIDLIVALGTTNITGAGRPGPEATFVYLIDRLRPGGWLLWGDLVWLSPPPDPLRQITEVTNLYTDDAGWRSAASRAGFKLEWSAISPQRVFDRYAAAASSAARDWLDLHPDAPEAGAVKASAERVAAILNFGRTYIGFGLYLLRKPGRPLLKRSRQRRP